VRPRNLTDPGRSDGAPDVDWKAKLKAPTKDARPQTEVSTKMIL